MKLKPKQPKLHKNYLIPGELVESLQKLASRLGYTETDLLVIALEKLIKENE